MVISEKQIMQLIENSRAYGRILLTLEGYDKDVQKISDLIREIIKQQSEELKVIE